MTFSSISGFTRLSSARGAPMAKLPIGKDRRICDSLLQRPRFLVQAPQAFSRAPGSCGVNGRPTRVATTVTPTKRRHPTMLTAALLCLPGVRAPTRGVSYTSGFEKASLEARRVCSGAGSSPRAPPPTLSRSWAEARRSGIFVATAHDDPAAGRPPHALAPPARPLARLPPLCA